jgi:hypothetical protein
MDWMGFKPAYFWRFFVLTGLTHPGYHRLFSHLTFKPAGRCAC